MRALLVAVPLVAAWSSACVECEQPTDCPGDAVCSPDGRCVDAEPLDLNDDPIPVPDQEPVDNPTEPGGNDPIDPPDDTTPPPDTDPGPSGNFFGQTDGTITGDIGNVDAQREAANVTYDSYMLQFTTPDGLLVNVTSSSSSLEQMLTTEGTYAFDGFSFGDVYGVACSPGYDEPVSEGEIVVSATDTVGEMDIELNVSNSQSSVTAKTTIQF